MVLRVDDLGYAYGRRQPHILEGLDWVVPDVGKTVLLGPNGAGKTTLLKLLAGQLKPQRGTVRYEGIAGVGSPRGRVAWMPQHITAVPRLSVREQVAYAGWLGGLSQVEATRRTLPVLEQVRLADKAEHRADSLSGGQLRRVGLAEALVLRAQHVLLDEPTAGLDPAQRANFREVLQGLDDCSLTVSTHQIEDVAEVFDRVSVLTQGTLRFDGNLTDFLALGPAGAAPGTAIAVAFGTFVADGGH